MAETRRDPSLERKEALGDWARAVWFVALAVGAWVFVHSYWPEDWTFTDKSTRERYVLIAVAGLGLLCLVSLAGALRHTARWLEARRYERMLADPATAALVPPTAAHVASVRPSPSGTAIVGACAIVALGAVGLIGYGLLALAEVVPTLHDEQGRDMSGSLVLFGAFLAVCGIAAFRRFGRWRTARTAERLSEDRRLAGVALASGAPAAVARVRADVIPPLDVDLRTEPETAVPTSRPTPERNVVGEPPARIAYLRLFDNVAGTERFLRGPWRMYGYVHLLRSAASVDDDELDAAERSDTASMFIATPEQLEAALRLAPPPAPSADPMPEHGVIARVRWAARQQSRLAYPVCALLCHGSFWQAAVDVLLARVDVVALDLGGYRPEHAGTHYELQRVVDRIPIERVVLLADATSDRPFLAAQVQAAWRQMAAGSPNATPTPRRAVIAVGGSDWPSWPPSRSTFVVHQPHRGPFSTDSVDDRPQYGG